MLSPPACAACWFCQVSRQRSDVRRGSHEDLRVLHDVERNACCLGEAGAAQRGGDNLVVTATGAKKIAEPPVFSAETLGSVMVLEASHTPDPALDAAMVLFKAIVQIATRPVLHGLAQQSADRSGVGTMTVCRHPVRLIAHDRPR
jgi:hypothetical protein